MLKSCTNRPAFFSPVIGALSAALFSSNVQAGDDQQFYGPTRSDAGDFADRGSTPAPRSRPDVEALIAQDMAMAPIYSRGWLDAALSSGAEITEVYGYDVDFYCLKTARRCGAQPKTSLQLSSTIPSDMLISDRFDGYFSRQVSVGAAIDLTDSVDLYGEATYRDTGDMISQDATPLDFDDGAVLFGWGARFDF